MSNESEQRNVGVLQSKHAIFCVNKQKSNAENHTKAHQFN